MVKQRICKIAFDGTKQCYKKLYHITDAKNLDSIMKNGLKPSWTWRAKTIPEHNRTKKDFAVFLSDDIDFIERWDSQLQTNNVVILEVDVPKIVSPIEYHGGDFDDEWRVHDKIKPKALSIFFKGSMDEWMDR